MTACGPTVVQNAQTSIVYFFYELRLFFYIFKWLGKKCPGKKKVQRRIFHDKRELY